MLIASKNEMVSINLILEWPWAESEDELVTAYEQSHIDLETTTTNNYDNKVMAGIVFHNR